MSLFKYERRKSIEVKIGNLLCGGDNPVIIQSMTTTDTMDTLASVEQSIRMIDSGCQMVRLTAPSKKDAKNLQVVKDELRKRGYNTPLIADIHFTPNAAEIAARIVEKVRINPGNYVDKKKFDVLEYTDEEYNAEIERIRERFTPLVKICKEYGTAMRIGTNHGSLSDRILSRYGDTPNGMVESALEFLRICESLNYYNVILSMKSSNPQVMVQAYRLLVQRLDEEGLKPYPLHLGVTEAGEGEDGRVKSALGIGTLLEDGIGDTVRVSLTEEPEYEIPIAQKIVEKYNDRSSHSKIIKEDLKYYSPLMYQKRKTHSVLNIGDDNVPVVISDLSLVPTITRENIAQLGYNYEAKADKFNLTDNACDYIFINNNELTFEVPESLGVIQNFNLWKQNKSKKNYFPFLDKNQYLNREGFSNVLTFLYVCYSDFDNELITKLKLTPNVVLIIDTYNEHGMAEQRALFFKLMNNGIVNPVVIGRAYGNLPIEDLQLQSATDIGALFLDGFGDGVFIAAENCGTLEEVNKTAFNILQASRVRISKTEYISCPSCGRTLFDLQETTAKIRKVTSHLKGLKIGIMGCIVNGPGEMADADYGYVGVGKGKISLYKGQEVVKKGIASENAVQELIELIAENGDWVDA